MMAGAGAVLLEQEEELEGHWIPKNIQGHHTSPGLLIFRMILCEK